MIGNTLPEYIFIRLCILLLRLIAPLSIIYLFACFFTQTSLISVWVLPLALLEASFYLLVYLPRWGRLQRAPEYLPDPLTRVERQDIFARCLSQSQQCQPNPSPSSNFQPQLALCFGKTTKLNLSGWFLPQDAGVTPKKEDVIDWLLWALFISTRRDPRVEGEWKEELQGYVRDVEEHLNINDAGGINVEGGVKLDEGSRDTIKCMRLTFDPVLMLHRPLVWYLIVALVDTYTSIRLSWLGFRHYSPPGYFQSFPPRPILTLFSRRAPPGVPFPYWYRPHRSRTRLPMVFIHGIGIGLYPYILFFRTLVQRSNEDLDPDDGEPGILLPELLPISMHMTPSPVPPKKVMLEALNVVLESLRSQDQDEHPADGGGVDEEEEGRAGRFGIFGRARESISSGVEEDGVEREYSGSRKATGWDQVVLIGHSYGTFVAGWVVKDCIHPEPEREGEVAVSAVSHGEDTSERTPLLAPITTLSTNTTPRSKLSDKIAHLVLIDPVPILLSHPTLAHNFVYREPWTVSLPLDASSINPTQTLTSRSITAGLPPPNHHILPLSSSPSLEGLTNPPPSSSWRKKLKRTQYPASTYQLWYFASRDADVARTLSRAFFWAEGAVWKEDFGMFVRGRGSTVGPAVAESSGSRRIRGSGSNAATRNKADGEERANVKERKVAIVLAGQDQIVPSREVWEYLTGTPFKSTAQPQRWAGRIPHELQSDVSAEEMEVVEVERELGVGVDEEEGGGVEEMEVLMFPSLDHANVFEGSEEVNEVVRVVHRLQRVV